MAKTKEKKEGEKGLEISRRKGSQPLYHQMVRLLRDDIIEERLKVNDQLPTELELCARFNVSRATVRQALQVLLHEGLITRHAGRGTFVRERSEFTTFNLRGTMEDIFAAMAEARVKRLSLTKEKANADVQRALRLGPEEEVFCARSVRIAHDVPLMYSLNYLLPSLGQRLEEEYTSERTLAFVLERKLGVRFESSRQIIRAALASKEVAKYLQVPKGDPVLFLKRVFFDGSGTPFHLVIRYCAGSRYQYVVDFSRDQRSYPNPLAS